MLRNHQLRTAVQIARAAVIAQATPEAHDLIGAGSGKVNDGGATLQKFGKVPDDRGNLRLLEHDFRQPYAVGVLGVLPRQGIAPMRALPRHNMGGKVTFLHSQTSSTSTGVAAATASKVAASWAAIR